ncbi:hypothetical protein SAMN05421856_1232 [Chryseobacterium taichungense]|uniref:Uncharacterized protein n=1 Tax=Chryseobacterium taichungense TaxID=295069 RepID=A0A1H8DYI9_9FLAO|nr:hypothetical protein [Chryseobacterium taichungense]SEN12226.1 hypothetical protein SAMN05421856_1232 [Chryseobacterium taichungense]
MSAWSDSGTPDYPEDDISKGEIYASHIENKIRAEWGLSLRSSYALLQSNVSMGKMDLTTLLMDRKGNSLWYDNYEKQLNQITKGEKYPAYQSFLPKNQFSGLLNRYNYEKNAKSNIFLHFFLVYNSMFK